MPKKEPQNPTHQQDDFIRWSAYSERSKAVSDYTEILKDADKRSVIQVEKFSKSVQSIYLFILGTYSITTFTVLVVFGVFLSFLLASTENNEKIPLSIIGIFISLFILLILVYRNPMKSARQVIGEFIKMQIIYLGYLRQVNQIDMGFKQTYLTTKRVKPQQLKKTFSQTQHVIENAIDDINLLLEELG